MAEKNPSPEANPSPEESTPKKILNYLIKTLNGMALGLFSTLIIGVIIEQIGLLVGNVGFINDGVSDSLITLANTLKGFMGIGIGIGIAWSRDLKGLALIAGGIAGGVGTSVLSDPVVAYLTVIAAVEGVRFILRKRTPFDIILIPMVSAIIAFVVAMIVGEPVSLFMSGIGAYIKSATDYTPFFMGIVIAVLMGMALTSPISSAAIAFSISSMEEGFGLIGIAGGAAVVGGATQMLGFAVMSRKDNNIGTVISIGIGTSMLQFKNILKKPVIWLPPIIVSAILGPISTLLFRIESTEVGAGMGTSSLIGQIGVLDAMGHGAGIYLSLLILHFALPIAGVLALDILFRKKGLIKAGDLKL